MNMIDHQVIMNTIIVIEDIINQHIEEEITISYIQS